MVLSDKNQIITLPDNLQYIQAKTCAADISNGSCEIESRFVGFYLGNNKVLIRVHEETGNINVEIC